MKKVLAVIISLCILVAVFAACSANNKGTADITGDPKNTSSAAEEWQKTTITTDTAKLVKGEAVAYIKSYSAKELSLSEKEMKECDFMFSGTGFKIEGDYYVMVTAVIKKETGTNSEGNKTYTFDTKGEYYIRYDGKQVLKKDIKTGEYKELKLHKTSEKTSE